MSHDYEDEAFKGMVLLLKLIPVPGYSSDDAASFLHRYLSIPREVRMEMFALCVNLAMSEVSKLDALLSPFHPLAQPIPEESAMQFFADVPVVQGEEFQKRRSASAKELCGLGVISWEGGETPMRLLDQKKLPRITATMLFFEGLIMSRKQSEKEGRNRQHVRYDHQTCQLAEIDPKGVLLWTMQLERGSENELLMRAMYNGMEKVAKRTSDLRRELKVPAGATFRIARPIQRLRLQKYFRKEGRMVFFCPYLEGIRTDR